jgi:flagellar basal-body rod protein FlgG
MIGEQLRQEAVANNIANVTTTGYKKAISAERGFYQIFLDAIAIDNLKPGDVPGGGMLLDATATDFSQGNIEHTGEPLDVALDGPGFFVLEGPAGNKLYTRSGHFTLNRDGELVTENGYKVQGEGGAISAAGANITISDDGRVVVDGAERGVLQVVTFEDPRVLARVGDTMFGAPQDVFPGIAEPVKMISGALESSNISIAKEMIDMLTTARRFEANQRVILAVDSTLDKTINDVGRT